MCDLDSDLAIFAVPPFDMVEDLCGDPLTADLNVLVAGNQFMVMPDLIAGFIAGRPHVREVFYETLPPGILINQVRMGGLAMGALRLHIRPDVIAASSSALAELVADGLCGPYRTYATNDLTVLVAAGNPLGLTSLEELAGPGVRVAIPDPKTEGIGRLALDAFEKAGGIKLREQIEFVKRADQTALFTTIHHRQSPAWLSEGAIDAAIVWSTEALFHIGQGAAFEEVKIDSAHNRIGDYAAAVLVAAPHPDDANASLDYLVGANGSAHYGRHGFETPYEA